MYRLIESDLITLKLSEFIKLVSQWKVEFCKFPNDKRFILLHGFQKKTQKTPKKEIDLSKERMKAFLANEKAKHPPKNKDQTQKKGKKR